MYRPEPVRTQVRIAFADSIRVIWLVVIPFVSCFFLKKSFGLYHLLRLLKGGVGLIAALGMKAYRLETVTDEVRKQFLCCFSAADTRLVAMGYCAKEKRGRGDFE